MHVKEGDSLHSEASAGSSGLLAMGNVADGPETECLSR
jgi:hypothetical protein